MTYVAKLACPAAIAALLAFAAPAHAQFGGGMDMNQMQQFAPMLEMMKQKMGKKQFGKLMQTMGPMMTQMEGQGGLGGGMGGMGGMANGFDMSQMMSMMGSMKGLMGGGRRGKARRRHSS